MSRYIDADKLKEYFGMGADDCQMCVHNPNDCRYRNDYSLMDFCSAVDEIPTANVVSVAVVEQIKWERDTAIQQLADYGIGFGEQADAVKVVRCKDCKYYGLDAPNVCDFLYAGVNPDWYCWGGEREEE